MATSYGALCTDFYINQKIGLKMDLPSGRETVLHFFDQVRKAEPSMNRFRRYDDELALESSRREAEYRWISLRNTSIRSGHVNPETMEAAFKWHHLVLQIAPYHLTISPIDFDFLEMMYGFDLECKDDHDEVIHEALFKNTPIANMLDLPNARPLNLEPAFGVSFGEEGELQAYFEIKTRQKNRKGKARGHRNDPISLFLTVRRYGPVDSLEELLDIQAKMARQIEGLASERFVPEFLMPVSKQITSSP